jgi:hypothetical protein
MKISTLSDTNVKIQWTNRTTQNDSIIVERKIDNSDFTYLAKISPTSIQYTDISATTGKTFYYRLRANLKDSIEIQSYPIKVLLTHTAVQEMDQDNLLIYPNPAIDKIFISGLNNKAKVSIYNICGTLEATKTVSVFDNNIHINELAEGIYILNIESEDKSWSKKIQKVRI